MIILGIDYGRAKVGLALGDTGSRLAGPLVVLKDKDFSRVAQRIKRIVTQELVEKIVMGVSEGPMAEESKRFGNKLNKELDVPVEFIDETLTSKDAQRLSIEAGIGRKKRKGMEDAYSAALILQSYLDK